MSKSFSTMKTEVGVNINDTSSTVATLIGTWINNKYFDILRRTNWNAIDDDYSFSLSVGATLVSLPSDFGKEITCYDSTNKKELAYIDIRDLVSTHPDTKNDTGDVSQYSIVETVNSSGIPYKYFKPYKIPTTALTVEMPYTLKPLALTSDGGYFVINCEDIAVLGATAEAWRYKRQFSKAQDYELLYEKGINMLIWDKENQVNQLKMFNPQPYSREIV